MRVEDIINDQFIKDKIQEHIDHTVECEGDCDVIRFEYPEGSGVVWKITCQYINENGDELILRIKRRK
jgi:RecB family endonuclease NucS